MKMYLTHSLSISNEMLVLGLEGGAGGLVYISSLLLFKPRLKKQAYAVLKSKLNSG